MSVPDIFSFAISLLSYIITLLVWATLLYNLFARKPKIKGRIYNVITGDIPDPRDPTKDLTAFNVYLYLTNIRKNTIHILDYELEVDLGQDILKLKEFMELTLSQIFG
jgi:hypothetical protein